MERRMPETDEQVLDRAFLLIDIISESGTDMSIEDLAEKSGLSRSVAYRLAESLTAHGYLKKTANGHYTLGMKVVSLAGGYINNKADMAKTAEDPMTQLWRSIVRPCCEPLPTRKEGEWGAPVEEFSM